MSTSVTGTSPCAPSSFARRGSRRLVPTSRCWPRSTVIRCSPGRAGSSSPPSIRNSPTTREFTSCSWIRYGRRGMSGHSKWSSIKHKKGAADAKRGKLFSKLARALIVAAREGGGDPAANLALQNAIEKARSYSMPKENIERAIARGSGADTAAELTMVPKTTVNLDEENAAKKTLRLIDALEESDDVQEVYSNFDIPEQVMEAVAP